MAAEARSRNRIMFRDRKQIFCHTVGAFRDVAFADSTALQTMGHQKWSDTLTSA